MSMTYLEALHYIYDYDCDPDLFWIARYRICSPPIDPSVLVGNNCLWSGQCMKNHVKNVPCGSQPAIKRDKYPQNILPGQSLLISNQSNRIDQVINNKVTKVSHITTPTFLTHRECTQSPEELFLSACDSDENSFNDYNIHDGTNTIECYQSDECLSSDSLEINKILSGTTDLNKNNTDLLEENVIPQNFPKVDLPIHSDHCYTRSRTKLDGNSFGIQAPSDSEDEIVDVVTIIPSTINYKNNSNSPVIDINIQKKDAKMKSINLKANNLKNTNQSLKKNLKRLNKTEYSDKKTKRISSGTKKYQPEIDETEMKEKRIMHNNMERLRRIGLKNLTDLLKLEIPSIKHQDKVAKVNVLKEAKATCDSLTDESSRYGNFRNQLLMKQTMLQNKFKSLTLLSQT